PLPDARVSTPLSWDELPTAEAEAFTISTVPARFASIGDPGAGIDGAVGSLDALLELSRRDEAEGIGDAPWPPNYRKQEGEPPRVQPARQRRATADYDTPKAAAAREKARAALERRLARQAEGAGRIATGASGPRAASDAPAAQPVETARLAPTGRRQSRFPLVEI